MGKKAKGKKPNSNQHKFLRELGKQKPYFSIGTAPITSKFMVFLHQCGEYKGISPHYKKEDALFALSKCQECADSFPQSFWTKSLDWTLPIFIQRLNKYFNYQDDDEVIGLYDPKNGGIDTRRSSRLKAMKQLNSLSDDYIFTVEKPYDDNQ